jgi:hypothetical protein
MSPFPVNPRWYEEYWMTERPPRLLRLAAAMRRLRCLFSLRAKPQSRAEVRGPA